MMMQLTWLHNPIKKKNQKRQKIQTKITTSQSGLFCTASSTFMVKKDGLKIFTLEGTMNANIGDWIIKGVKGEFYPCKPDIFEETYEKVEE